MKRYPPNGICPKCHKPIQIIDIPPTPIENPNGGTAYYGGGVEIYCENPKCDWR